MKQMNTNAVMRCANGTFLALTIFFAASFFVASYRVALADGPGDGVCANVVDDTTPCPSNAVSSFNVSTSDYTCRSSTAWYFSFPAQGPYYNCCRYQGAQKLCQVPASTGGYSFPPAGYTWYYRSTSDGSSTCHNSVTSSPDRLCIAN